MQGSEAQRRAREKGLGMPSSTGAHLGGLTEGRNRSCAASQYCCKQVLLQITFPEDLKSSTVGHERSLKFNVFSFQSSGKWKQNSSGYTDGYATGANTSLLSAQPASHSHHRD